MNYSITALQIGEEDYRQKYHIPEKVTWIRVLEEDLPAYMAQQGEDLQQPAVLWITSAVQKSSVEALSLLGKDYCVLYTGTDDVKEAPGLKALRRVKYLRGIPEDMVQEILDILPQIYFDGQYGAKLHVNDIEVNQDIREVSFRGHDALILEGNFGKNFRPLLSWRNNIPMEIGEPLEIWLEYTADPGVELELVIHGNESGSVHKILNTWHFQEELNQYWATILEGNKVRLMLAFSLRIKGKGKVEIGILHYRYSRMGASVLLPGGKKDQDSGRGEFYSLFEPRDRKPPLNVYFSGYRTAEGFEGYYMMHRMKAPFLLIGDARLKGGAFYLGSEEFEEKVKGAIEDALQKLGFTHDQLILSGISMGSFGAAYYSSDLKPHSVILGKPLMNLGNVAAAEKYLRPGGFPTSLDVLLANTGGMGPEEIERLNNRLWDKFDKSKYEGTDFAIAYMMQDDYDPDGYPDLVKHLTGKNVNIYGKGIVGRHNDNTAAVAEWFMNRYGRILEASFGRG